MEPVKSVLKGAPRIGMGCWAIGGYAHAGGVPIGYSGADDAESRKAIEAAWDAGVRVFDTAAGYGAGHSEHLLGEVLGNRDGSVLITKFAPLFDEAAREIVGEDLSPVAIRASALASRDRLKRSRIDVLLCHKNMLDIADAPAVFDTLDGLRAEGVIGEYGWSTDFPERLAAVAARPGFTTVEHGMNLFFDAPSISKVAERYGLTQVIRSPLAMGLLTGKFRVGDRLDASDVRSNTFDWMDYFKGGVVSREHLDQIAALRDLLTVGGRSVGQGALGWLLAKSPALLPVPGARTAAQVRENAEAMNLGPLPPDIMSEIETVIDRPPEGPPRER